MLKYEQLPNWIINLDIEDISYIKKLILYSGSLKELAKEYDVSYPTIRIRMDKLIEKVKLYDKEEIDPYIEKIKLLAINDKIDLDTAKILIQEYRSVKKNGNWFDFYFLLYWNFKYNNILTVQR